MNSKRTFENSFFLKSFLKIVLIQLSNKSTGLSNKIKVRQFVYVKATHVKKINPYGFFLSCPEATRIKNEMF